ncbi:MAG: Gfo/Idh/MocA family oxidoreductase [Planctomycetaceae bacterium]|nr:Gfo/Idh/MocA family oxidoreductase [Planctomycetaceae bacterium]
MTQKHSTPSNSRRDFLKSGALAVGGSLAGSMALNSSLYAEGSSVLKVALIGCGGRGTGAAKQALMADPNVQLVAMGDAFQDRLEKSHGLLKKDEEVGDKVNVSPEKMFVGFDAYRQVIDSGVDVVLLCTPPHFRPAQLAYAIEKGKHVFAEKPVAVDAQGVKSVMETCRKAKEKNLSIVSGLCWRYDNGMRATFEQVHAGAVGDIVAIQVSYNTQGLWMHPRKPEWSDMEWQVRNWLYFTWLSGDFNVEQHVHSLDKMAWAMKDETPVKCVGLGGRQVRTGPEFGHIFDHMSVVYEYANGVKGFASCRQQDGTHIDVSDHIMGTKGTCNVFRHTVSGESKWKYDGPKNNMYQTEHDELFASIRNSTPINNGEYMCRSTMLAIMGRMACYTGKEITWDQAMDSQENLTPEKYEWGPMAVAPVAMPGLTQFI